MPGAEKTEETMGKKFKEGPVRVLQNVYEAGLLVEQLTEYAGMGDDYVNPAILRDSFRDREGLDAAAEFWKEVHAFLYERMCVERHTLKLFQMKNERSGYGWRRTYGSTAVYFSNGGYCGASGLTQETAKKSHGLLYKQLVLLKNSPIDRVRFPTSKIGPKTGVQNPTIQ